MTIKLIEADHYSRNELEALSIDQLRELYRSYLRAARYGISRNDIDAQLASMSPDTPIEHVLTIRSVSGVCDKCNGCGIYYWGARINGTMSHGGTCFRCGGKGKVNVDDCRRNYGYDNHAIVTAFRGMCG